MNILSGAAKPVKEHFDAMERAQVGDDLAESAFAIGRDWDGKTWSPPASEQPGVYAWGEAHLQYAYSLQFEATGNPRYLDVLVSRFRRLLALRDDRVGRRDELRGRVMPAWGSVRFSTLPPFEGKSTCWAVHAGMILYPAARFVRIVQADPGLSKRYAGPVAEFRQAIAETLDAYDEHWHENTPASGGEPEGYYTEPMAGPDPLPLNQMNTLGRIMLELAVTGSDPQYRQRVEKLARFMKRRMHVNSREAYEWDYRPSLHPPFNAGGREDISHASINVDFMVRCHQVGIVFDAADVQRMVRTLLDVVRKPDGRLADRVDGTGDSGAYADVIAWWGRLALVDKRVAGAIREYYARLPTLPGAPGGLVVLAMLSLHEKLAGLSLLTQTKEVF